MLIVVFQSRSMPQIVSKYSFKKINQYKLASFLFGWSRGGLIVIETDRLRFVVELVEQIFQKDLEMFEGLLVLIVEAHPDLNAEAHSVWIFGRDKSESIDFL